MSSSKTSGQPSVTGVRKIEEKDQQQLSSQFPIHIFAFALILRIVVLFGFSDILTSLQSRIELVTPVSSFSSVKEGVFLFYRGISPYEGGIYRQSPLLLPLFSALDGLNNTTVSLVYILLDLFLGFVLWQTSVRYLPRAYEYKIVDTTQFDTLQTENDSAADSNSEALNLANPKAASSNTPKLLMSFTPNWVPAMYLLNPYVILSCFSLSTTIINNIIITLSILAAVNESMVLATLFLALATHLTLFPIALFPALYLLTFPQERSRNFVNFLFTLTLFFAWLGLMTFAAYHFSGSLRFIDSVYGTLLWVRDLTPNVGLFWYFFIEMFHQFRSYFLAAFQYVHIIPVLPLAYRYSDHPMLVLVIQLGLASIYKPYPALADAGFYMSFLPMFVHLDQYMSRQEFIFGLLVAHAGLGPVFWQGWIIDRALNANFFYASTIVYTLAHTLLLIDLVQSYRRFDFTTRHPTLAKKKLKLA